MVVTMVVTTGFLWLLERGGEAVYGHEVPPEGLRDSLELILLLESLFDMETMLRVQPAPPRCSGLFSSSHGHPCTGISWPGAAGAPTHLSHCRGQL